MVSSGAQAISTAATSAAQTVVTQATTVAHTVINSPMNPVANLAQVVHALNSAATTVAPAFQSTIIDKLPGPLQSVWSDLSSPAAFTLGFTEGMADGTMSVFNQMADAIPAMASTASSIASCTIFMSCAGLASDLSSAAQAVSTDDPAKIIDSAKHFALDPFADIANHAASGDWNGAGVASGHAAVGVVQAALAVSGICEAVMADSCFLPTIADMMDLADAADVVTGANGEVAVDSNPVIAALNDPAASTRVDQALAGRTPVLSPQGLNEVGSDALDWLSGRGGRVGAAADPAQVAELQQKATALGRVLKTPDANVLSSAMQDGLSVITNDLRFGRFMDAINYPNERW